MTHAVTSPIIDSVIFGTVFAPTRGSKVGRPAPKVPSDSAHEAASSRVQSRLFSDAVPASRDGKEMQADPIQSEDEQLVAKAQAGNSEAFDELVLKRSSRIYGLVFNMTNNHEDTNDLLQEIWSKVFRSLASFRGASKFSTWLHSIAVHMTINFLKRRNRRSTLSLDATDDEGNSPAETLLVSEQTPRHDANLSELQKRLTHALNKLTPDHRAVVTMFDIQGMAHAEIAKIMGTSEGTVRSRLFYAHRQLQNYLSDFQPAAL